MVYIRPIDEKVRDKYKHCDRLLRFTTPSEFPDIKNAAMCRIVHRLLEEEEPYQEDMQLAVLPPNMPALVVNPEVLGALSDLLRQHIGPERSYNAIAEEDRKRIGSFAAEIITVSRAYDNARG